MVELTQIPLLHSVVRDQCNSGFVEVSADVVARVPAENVRVGLGEFGALWARAEDLGERPGVGGDFLVGVILTCRWLAARPVRSLITGRAEIPCAPLTGRRSVVMPETVEAELLAAYSRFAVNRELAKGVAATLEWAWRGSGQMPLDVRHTTTG